MHPNKQGGTARAGVSTLRVTWQATFRRRTDLEAPLAPRGSEVNARWLAPRPCPALRHCLAVAPNAIPNATHLTPCYYMAADSGIGPILVVTIQVSNTRSPRTGTPIQRDTPFPIKYHRQVYWHQVSPTIAQVWKLFITYTVFSLIRKHFFKKSLSFIHTKTTFMKKNIEHNRWTQTIHNRALSSAKQSGISNRVERAGEWENVTTK